MGRILRSEGVGDIWVQTACSPFLAIKPGSRLLQQNLLALSEKICAQCYVSAMQNNQL